MKLKNMLSVDYKLSCLCSLLQIYILITSVTSSRDFTVTFACPQGWKLIGTHCFIFIKTELDFYDSFDVCNKYGAVLLNVRDEVEAKNISLESKNVFLQDHYWISNGCSDDTTCKYFISPNCSGYWQINEPSSLEGDVAVASNLSGRWALKSAWMSLPFVCRSPACPTDTFRCSDGTCLNQRWKCDKVFDCPDGSDENDCSECYKHFKSSTGTMDSNSDDNCQWILEGTPGQVLQINFESLILVENVATVFVYSGGPTIQKSTLMKELKVNDSGITVYGVNHFLIVRLRSYGSSPKPVIKATWRADTELSKEQVENVNITDIVETISTPYFDSNIVPSIYKKKWILTTDVNSVITVEITNSTFDLNTTDLMISPVSFFLYEPNTNRAIYISTSSSLTIIAKVNQQETKRMRAKIWKGCNFNTTLTLATFELRDAFKNRECLWRIQNLLPTDFTMTLINIHFQESSDWLKVYNGTNEDFLIQTVNTSSEDIPFFNIYNGVTLKYYSTSTSESLNKFKAKISAECELVGSNINVLEQPNRTAGENYHVDISCQQGFAFLQEEYNYTSTLKAICSEDGVWNFGSETFKRYPKCQVIYCGAPLPIKNGYIEKLNNVTYNDTVVYSCYEGFTMNGPNESVCQSDGQWSDAGSCEAENCGEIPDIKNGSCNFSVGSNSTYGSVVKYSCNSGYDLIGSQQIVCLKSKQWSDSAPQCKILTCNLPSVTNGYYSNSNFTIEYNETVTLHCYGGYRNDRTNTSNATLQCKEDRNLTFTDSCLDIDECAENDHECNKSNMYCKNVNGSYDCICQPGYSMTDSECLDVNECENNMNICDHNCTNQNGSYTCLCGEGFDLYTSNGTNGFILPQGEDGTLPGHILHINHTCVRKRCEPLNIDNGLVLSKKEKFLYNDTVKIACYFGFRLDGSSSAYCSNTGHWTYDENLPPSCKVLSCPVPPPSKLELDRDPPGLRIKGGDSMKIICEQQCENCSNITKTVYCALNSSGEFQLQGDNPECFAVNCGQPLWEQLPCVVVKKDLNDTTYGSSFEFECDPTIGYGIQGSSSLGNTTVMCQRNGRWGFNSLRCQVLSCKDPGTKAGTEQTVKNSYEVGQSVRYNCTRPGFKARPNDTLTCEYINGTAKWSGDAPVCEDAEEPKITCPHIPQFNLFDTLIYNPPNISDNSGFACLVLESGPPSGVSVVSKNMMLIFKAFDIAYNSVNISCSVTLKDQTRPWIQCPGTIDYNMSEMNELVNVDSFKPHIVSFNDKNITFNPSEINLTLGDVYNVTASITKDNGYSAKCAFLIRTKTTKCHNETLTAPQNGTIKECLGTAASMTCIAKCKDGYVYQNLSTELSYNCLNGTWSSETPLLPCLSLMKTVFNFSVNLKYTSNISLVGFDKTTCLRSHNNLLTQLIDNMTVCNLSQFRIRELQSDEFGTKEVKSTFSLFVVPNGEDELVLQVCGKALNNSKELYGPTYPVNNCRAPWDVQSVEVKSGHLHCPNGGEIINNTICLQCGIGYYYNNSHCLPCSDGTYQDKEGQTKCEKCTSEKSYWPRTSKKHCHALCPDGFKSPSGLINDNCSQCPEYTYSSENRTVCLQCNSTTQDKYQCSVPCKPGEYSSTGYEPCHPCPKHFFSVGNNSTTCQECPDETYTLSNGSKSKSECLNASHVNCFNYCTKPGSNSNCLIRDHLVTCECLEGYHGHLCNESCNFCDSNPCENKGICSSNGSNITCQCTTAPNCTFEKNETLKYTSDPAYVNYTIVINRAECEEQCLNEDNCKAYLYDAVDKYCFKYHTLLVDEKGDPNKYESYEKICTQKSLFGGERCELDLINDCDTKNVCSEKDFCMDLINGTQCVCPLGGSFNKTCYKESKECDPNPCTHGRCVPFGTVHYICICDPGYTGQNCSENIDECELNPYGCLNNGNCTDYVNNYTCNCTSEYKGNNCEVLPDLCEGNQCLENTTGLCIKDYYNMSHLCVCAENYNLTSNGQQPSCQAIDFCQSSPCQNGGICTNKTYGFSCNCSGGFEGSRCQINITIKANETTCENVNPCKSKMKEYFCQQCQFDITNCTSCLDTCRNLNTLTAEERFFCQCFCQEPTTNNQCLLYEPCLHGGTCKNTTDNYTCECPTGWSGQNCETARDYCNETSPCEHSSVCSNLINDTFCHCMDGTSGKKCNETKDVCEYFGNNTCRYGTCESEGGSAKCVCQDHFAGKSCELLKNHCSADLCNGGKCYLNDVSFECNCDDVHHSAGDYCNATSNSCDKCPHSYNCTIYTDKEGINQFACLCPPDKIQTGNECSDVEKDFDLVFLKDFASSNKYLTSVMGFSLENVESLTVTMWVAAAGKLNDDDIILSLTSAQDETFLSILNSKIKFRTTEKSFQNFLDFGNEWHLIAVTWSTMGYCSIYFDYSLIIKNESINNTLPNVRFATVQLGKTFYGYISHVQLWKTILTSEEIMQLYDNKSNVTQASRLLLDWTYFPFQENTLISRPSLAKRETSICVNISSSALYPLHEICKDNTEDRIPPSVNGECKSWKLIATDYNQHQVSSSELGYSFIDSMNNNLQQPKLQYFSYGAYDIAVAANDSSGNIGVCMTRTFITYNQCQNTKPINFTESCSNSTGVKVTCPLGHLPSVLIPKLLACGQLKTFNLDHMYEKPDRIVCGKSSSQLVTIKIHLVYKSLLACSGSINSNAIGAINNSIVKMAEKWNGLCEDPQCRNTLISGICERDMIIIEALLMNIRERLNSTTDTDVKTLDIVKNTVEDGRTFDISAPIAGAQLNSNVNFTFSCHDGSTLIDNMCVECGEGSLYNKQKKSCELCPLNFYGNPNKQCFPCPGNKVTLQRGSSQVSDCVLNCTAGQMLNETINQCVPCPLNFYQDQPGKHYCLPCPPSHGTNTNGTAQLGACTEFCPPGTQRNNSGLCEPCPRGSYRVGDKQDQCSLCPVNLTTADTGQDRESDCIIPICSPGMFANSSNATTYTCVPCEIGYYQPDSASISCQPCSDNYTTVTTGSNNISQCLFYCQAGYEESPPHSKNCKPCQRGFYRPGDSRNMFSNCSQCPDDLTTDGEKSISLADCNIKICSSGYVLSSNLSTCQQCPHDTYQPIDPPTSNTVCINCTSGYGTVNVASNSYMDCQLFCQPGSGYSGSSDGCQNCSQGFWNNGNSSMRFERCQKCPVNYTTEGIGATDVNNCTLRDCPSGTYINGSDCVPCELGTYQPLPHQTQCNSCRTNTSTSSIASTSPDDCTIKCPNGTEGDAYDNCVPCGDNEYKSEETYGHCQNCTGDFTSEPNNRNNCTKVHCNYGREYINGMCSDCTKGHYKDIRGNFSCLRCPGNTSTAGQGSTSYSHCNFTYCEPGFFSIDNLTCTACDIGFYKNESGNQECTSCPENLTSPGVGSTHIANCSLRLCPVGYHRLNDSFCSPCGIGEYQDETGQIQCKKCPLINNLNSTTFNTTSTNISDCYPICGPGHFLDMAAKVCRECPYSSYKNTNDLNTTCQQCPTNFTTTSTGATSQQQCEYSICNKGEYRPNNSQTGCLKCPIGTYKTVSTHEPTNCTQCPPNNTTLIEGATNVDKYCILNCPGGQQYSLPEKSCTLCPVGQFKENSTVLNVCKYCAANQTTLTPGSTSCIPSNISPSPEISITLTVYIDIQLGLCGNPDHLKIVIQGIITNVIIAARRNKFQGLCPTAACENMIYAIVGVCVNHSKKRQTYQNAQVKLDLKDIASPLVHSDGTKRNTERAVIDLFWFDILPYEDLMMSNAITITNVTAVVVCPIGYSYRDTLGHCIQCDPGQYVNGDKCEDCSQGNYSTSPPSNVCEQCPEHLTTNKTRSYNVSDCKGFCYFDNNYCGGSGHCVVNSVTGIHECKCNENYQGFQCAERYSSENKDTMNIVVGISVAFGVLLFIVLLTLALCIKRNRIKSKKSSASDTDILSQGMPDFGQPVMFQNPAMFNDPTLYNSELMEFYDHDPSVYRKSSGVSDVYLANGNRLSVHSRQREYTP